MSFLVNILTSLWTVEFVYKLLEEKEFRFLPGDLQSFVVLFESYLTVHVFGREATQLCLGEI